LVALSQLAQNQPHGWAQWLTVAGSGLAAIGIHAASNTDGTK
jgi:hypothetical protein